METSFIQRLRQAVHQHLDDPDFGVDDLCNIAHLSRSQLHRRLKKQTGKSATLFIREVRLQEARRLLRGKKLSVTETAMETGFKDPAFFSRVFKKQYGIAPSKVRE